MNEYREYAMRVWFDDGSFKAIKIVATSPEGAIADIEQAYGEKVSTYGYTQL
jgi:hypothetical protein